MAGDCPHSGTGPCSGCVELEFVLGPTLEMWNENGLLQSCNSLLIFKTFFFLNLITDILILYVLVAAQSLFSK